MDDTKWLIAQEIPHLRRYARSLTNNADEADDLVQDCLERAINKRQLWTQKGSLRSWLFRMLYNLFLNGGRARKRQQAQVNIDDAPDSLAPDILSVNGAPDKRIECWRVAQALEELPPEQRDAVLLVSLESMPYDEAAATLGIPIGTLRSRVSRGREALRALVARGAGRQAGARAGEKVDEKAGATGAGGPGWLRRVK
ncbi:RNA polymerase sigma factor [Fodinicurvata sp. EGI_FJ10296]|uniref:RNA polymerase sigma factor n=1 Tax=Fodinicurvata sp. EGI_FJ10296 TaxID=3231908 RepID=UPI003452312D